MKKILVIDESELVRETIALILGQEFAVVKRPLGKNGLVFADSDKDVDLLILGITPAMGAEVSHLIRFASQVPFAVLFLLDSRAAATVFGDREKADCLAKPFNHYELKDKVGKLLASRNFLPGSLGASAKEKGHDVVRYAEFPYVSRSTASLARRFAGARLSILIYGEAGCGQERVARAIHALDGQAIPWVVLNATDVSEDYLAQKSLQISWHKNAINRDVTVFIENLEKLSPSSQASIANFLQDQEETGHKLRLLATARADLLDRVYQGTFLESLYYRLATLTLRLPSLRERREEVPIIASWFAQLYGARLGLGDIVISPDAIERLRNYLWFGNMHELEAVIARTLAVHRKTRIEAADLYWDFSPAERVAEPSATELGSEGQAGTVRKIPEKSPVPEQQAPAAPNGRSPDLKVLIHELAHELKNPMVTIKTFAQLLGERYQDEAFRARFQDIVDGDIERIDGLLEVMIEFANFSQPIPGKIPLQSQLRSVLEEISVDCARRQTQVRWKGENIPRQILADEAQLKYALKNAMLAVLAQSKLGSEIVIDMESPGALNIGYVREGGRINPITHYFDLSSAKGGEGILPLRILLAKQLVERNGGEMIIQRMDEERDLLKMEFPVAEGE